MLAYFICGMYLSMALYCFFFAVALLVLSSLLLFVRWHLTDAKKPTSYGFEHQVQRGHQGADWGCIWSMLPTRGVHK